ncbi:MAG: glutamate racemase, partial [Candidatus Omnitrophica bacterium]|nr:glutamate racemase [Candidatus Omnitrophota bacterium]
FREILGGSVTLIDSAMQVTLETKQVLANEGLLNKKRSAKYLFYVSDELQQFRKLAKNFLGREITNLRRVNNV